MIEGSITDGIGGCKKERDDWNKDVNASSVLRETKLLREKRATETMLQEAELELSFQTIT